MSLRPTSVWRRTPLWLRLITTVLALSIVALTVMGVFGARLLRGYLVDRVDTQLEAATRAVPNWNEARVLEAGLPSQYHFEFQNRAGTPLQDMPSTLGDTPPPDLPAITPREARARQGTPFTAPAVRGSGSWRAIALPVTDRAGGDVATVVIATSLHDVDATVHQLSTINLAVGAAVIAGLALAAYTMVRTALRPLTKIEQTAAAIAGGDLSRRVDNDDPNTEVGRLGLALNTMLEQIETAFLARQASEATARRSEEKMRRFVADASHELRTPLTSIRGFAELHRQGAVTDPAEVSRLLKRIEDEAKRMGLLVDDLLLLARLDQQRPFEHGPVDLRVLAADAVEAARATAPDREIGLDLPTGEADGELVVAGDEPRLRQVLSNLLDNALAYSPADSPITVLGGRTRRDDRDLAFVQVRDRGPGLVPEQAERVFERFYRTDRARSRAHGGTGLGLSIVAAITAAHGGSVELDTAPGEGATFRVLLPRLSDTPSTTGASSPPGTPSTPPTDVPPSVVPDDVGAGEPSLRP
jgi:two-component system, OmpR family, sensor kinase